MLAVLAHIHQHLDFYYTYMKRKTFNMNTIAVTYCIIQSKNQKTPQ